MSADARCHACMQGMYVFYLELVTDMLHLLVYVIFFVIVFTNYGLPLHLVRKLWTAPGTGRNPGDHPADTSLRRSEWQIRILLRLEASSLQIFEWRAFVGCSAQHAAFVSLESLLG